MPVRPDEGLQKTTQMARWSSGSDGGLSRRKHGFDSRTGHHLLFLERKSKQKELYGLTIESRLVVEKDGKERKVSF